MEFDNNLKKLLKILAYKKNALWLVEYSVTLLAMFETKNYFPCFL